MLQMINMDVLWRSAAEKPMIKGLKGKLGMWKGWMNTEIALLDTHRSSSLLVLFYAKTENKETENIKKHNLYKKRRKTSSNMDGVEIISVRAKDEKFT